MAEEWVYCPHCGQPVHDHGAYMTAVDSSFAELDVEHECRPDGRA